MRYEIVVVIVTLIGAVVAALSHGLQLVDRFKLWRANRHVSPGPTAGEEPSSWRRSMTRHLVRWRWHLTVIVTIVSATMLWALGGLTVWSSPTPSRPPAFADARSVAILPFQHLGSGEDGRVFADGLTENITSALATVPGLLVVARHSVMAYKERSPELGDVAREQGVRHVLSGSVLSSGERMRVTVQMSDVAGRLLWSERYDRSLQDLFDVQDDIALRVATALQSRLTEGEQARIRDRGTRNLESWRLATRGFEAFLRYDAASNAEARKLLEEAVRIDPTYPWAWAALGSARAIAARFGYADDPAAMAAAAEMAVRRAIALDPQLAVPHATLGALHMVRGEFDAAEGAGRQAVALAPSNSEIHAILAQTLLFRGRFEEAISFSRQAVRLSPRHPSWYLIWEAWGQVFLGNPSDGLAAAKRMLEIAESPLQRAVAYDSIAFAQAEAGRLTEARAAVAAAREAVAGHNLAYHRRTKHFEHPAHFERVAAALRAAGLPE